MGQTDDLQSLRIGSLPISSTKTYLVGYFNYYDELIQFTEIEATSGLDAMKQIECSPKLQKITDEEEFCQIILDKGYFIGYELLNY